MFRLRLLKLLLLCGSGAIGLIWVFEAWTNRVSSIDRVAYPTMIAIFSAACIALVVRPGTLKQVERLCFVTFAAYMVLHAQPSALAGVDIYNLASLAQWFPLIYAAAFFFLDTRQAMLVSGLVYLSLLVPYGANLMFDRAALWESDRALLMLNVFCSHPVYIVTLSGIARLKTHVMQARAHADALHIAASVDYLTGVANRRTAAHLLQQALIDAQARGAVVSIILLDIDHFKLINDTFGHDVGDEVLRQVAATLQRRLRSSDTLGRWGGEEFIVVAGATSANEAAQLAEQLRALVASHEFQQVSQVTASFGVASSLLHDTPEALVKRADEALYLAKQDGRNRIEAALTATAGNN
jgi:diguanylate cyclase (GGDEF)-like protein